ncbi:SdpI family protein [bacterium SCSIO 12741]|nr:SdpI family protein [bacterium SCSIO 12741]
MGLSGCPFIYLALIWSGLPESVPIHWDAEGNIDDWGPKITLLLIPILLPLLTYAVFLIVPTIDPKKKIKNMGGKFYQLRFWMTLFMSVLALYILYSSKEQAAAPPDILFILLGLLFVVMGNYFKTIRPNYFLGIRSPWTLENEQIWRKTHSFAGTLWLVGGMVIVLTGLLLSGSLMMVVFVTVTLIIGLVPYVYSYLQFKQKQITDS